MNIIKYLFNPKYRFFSTFIRNAEESIWEEEFKRYASAELREETRQGYDQLQSKLSFLESQIKAQKENPTMEEGEIKRLDDQKVLLDRDIKRTKERMDMLDVNIHGARPSPEHPEGINGINNKIDALHSRVGMIKDYLKTL